MRAWLPLLAACSAAAEPAPTVLHAPAGPPARVASRPAQPAAHGSIIAFTTVTADGGAAATMDGKRLLRLWPTLDGTREPIVVTGPAAEALALVRADHGFQLALLDAAGAIQIATIAQDGGQLPMRLVDSPLAYAQIEATRTGFVALRVDDLVELIATDGRRTAIPPRAKIDRLVVRGDAIVAITGGRARVLRDGAWSEPSAPLPFRPDSAVVSPDATRLAGRRDDGTAAELALATGAVRAFDRENPLGYTDANTLALIDFSLLQLVHPDGTAEQLAVPNGLGADLAYACGDGAIASGYANQLALIRGGELGYLGYDEVDAAPLRASPTALIARLDRPAFVDARLELVPLGAVGSGDWMDVVPLDATYAAVLHREWLDEMETRRVDIIDQKTGAKAASLPADARLDHIAYEPSTHLLATLSVDGAKLFRYAAGKLTPAGALPGAPDKVYLLDPALAHGDVALVVESGVASRVDANLAAHAPRRITGKLLAVDRAGELVDRGTLRAALARISPDRTLVAYASGHELGVVDRAGHTRWTATRFGLRDVAWTPSGRLVVAENGLLELDPATGEVLARRCGWRFSLRRTAHTGSTPGDSACDL